MSVRGQLIVQLDVLEDTRVNAAALLAPSHFLTDNYCHVQVHTARKAGGRVLKKEVFHTVWFFFIDFPSLGVRLCFLLLVW